MSSTVRQFVSATVLLIAAYLILVHFTGFATDVNAIGTNYAKIATTLQGR